MKTRLRAVMRAVLPALALVAGGSAYSQNSNPFPVSTYRNVATWQPGEVMSVPRGGFKAPINAGDLVELRLPVKAPSQPGMSEIDAFLKAKVNRPSLGVALGKFLKKTLPTVTVGLALFDLAQDLGILAERGPDGLPIFSENVPGTYVGVEFSGTSPNYVETWHASRYAACATLNGRPLSGGWHYFGAVPFGPFSLPATSHSCEFSACDVNGSQCQSEKGVVSLAARETNISTTTTRIVSPEEFVERVINAPSITHPTAGPDLVEDIIDSGESVQFDPYSVTGPQSTDGPVTVTINNDNTTTTTSTVHNHTYDGPSITTTTVRTTVVTNTTTGEEIDRKTETTTPVLPKPDSESKFKMPCGIPGTPPCNVKVDETGVPVPTDIKIDQADDALDDWDDFVTNLPDVLPKFPTISWDFALPTGCGVIPLPAFEPYLTGVDICQYQPMFHSLMSVVWVLGGLFGAISLFMRSALTMN